MFATLSPTLSYAFPTLNVTLSTLDAVLAGFFHCILLGKIVAYTKKEQGSVNPALLRYFSFSKNISFKSSFTSLFTFFKASAFSSSEAVLFRMSLQ